MLGVYCLKPVLLVVATGAGQFLRRIPGQLRTCMLQL
jgi:hypothetical protein